MAINKVVFGNDTLIDLTEDSVSASNLLEGETAHDRSGASVTGTAKQGHVIQNANGTDLTQRAKLQFADADVTDDSTNQKTIVNVVRERTQAQYDAMSAADQAKGIIQITDANAKPLFDTQVRLSSGSGTVADKLGSLSTDVSNKVSDNPVFTEAQTRANIASGESFATILGKIKKWFSDLASMFVSKTGDTMTGNLTIDNGSSQYNSILQLGGNQSYGAVRFQAGVTGYRASVYSSVLTANRAIAFPDKGGVIALTSDLSNPYVAVSGTTDEYCRCSYTVSSSSTGTVLDRIQDFISHLDTHSKLIMFDAIIYGSGQFRFSGYIYPNKNYGGGIFYAFNNICIWMRDNGTDTVKIL